MQPVDEILETLGSPVSRELLEQKYKFAHPYTDTSNKNQIASVYLHVNFSTKEFKILPGDGRDQFGFVSGSHKFDMWIATTKCIEAAIEFAVETLNLKTNEPSLAS